MNILGFTVTRTENIKELIRQLRSLEVHVYRHTFFKDENGKTIEKDRDSREITSHVLTNDKAFLAIRSGLQSLFEK